MIYARYATCDPLLTKRIDTPDQLLPYFVMDVLAHRTGVAGVFVTGIFMASLSSVSSAINALATVFYVDVIAVLRPDIKESTGSHIMVGLGVFFGMVSIALVAVAMNLGDVLAAQSAINSGIGGPLLGLFSMGMFIPHVSSKGAMLGLLTSLGIALWICIGSLVNPTVYPAPPLSVDGCPTLYRNVTNSSKPYVDPVLVDEPEGIYALSYLWQSLVAFLISFAVGIPASFYATANDPKTMNPKLICPIVDILFPYLPERYRRPFRFKLGQNYRGPATPRPSLSQGKSWPQANITIAALPVDPESKIIGLNVSRIQALTEQLYPEQPYPPVKPLRSPRSTPPDPGASPTGVVCHQEPPFSFPATRRRNSSNRGGTHGSSSRL
ncbi:hypothetical protein V5799_016806 [Amblyomma americanum]|uniref:Sodium/solute symporter n=1 Tax=Amblyomma americanum TaxID=6943 RepID=A0AAQ4F564_AMBAM